ncbi:hypothetical protein ASG61_16730 [Bacillus sp. Leaf75]|nr:hypothetical protein ASG61_16730 [Bacillus sp. Leaf75]
MNKELMTNAVETLIKYKTAETESERNIFYKFLEGMCDTESDYYILGHLELLADVLKEKECAFLVDYIAKYDYKAAQQLDVHLIDYRAHCEIRLRGSEYKN